MARKASHASRPAAALALVTLLALLALMQPLALVAIAGYQRFVSPHKGFTCAHHALWDEGSCSGFAARSIRERGLLEGLFLLRARFDQCGAAERLLERQADGTWQCSGSHCNGSGTFRCCG